MTDFDGFGASNNLKRSKNEMDSHLPKPESGMIIFRWLCCHVSRKTMGGGWEQMLWKRISFDDVSLLGSSERR